MPEAPSHWSHAWPAAVLSLLLILAGNARGEQTDEPPELPWATGGEVQVGDQKCRMLPDGAYPEYEALLPRVAPGQNPVRYYFAASRVWKRPENDIERLRPGDAGWEAAQPALKEWLDGNAVAFKLLDRAAELPTARWPFLASVNAKPDQLGLLLMQLMPHLSQMRSFSRGRAALVRQSLSGKNLDEAVRQFVLALVLGRHLEGGGTLIQELVAAACDSQVLEALEDVLCSPGLTREQLAQLAKALDDRAARLSDGASYLKGEELGSLQILDGIFSGKYAEDLFGRGYAGLPPGWELAPQEFFSTRAFRIVFPDRAMRRHFTDYYAACRGALQQPYWKVRGGPDDPQRLAAKIPEWDLFARMMIPAVGATQTQFVKHRVSFDLARVAVALKRAALDTGQRPASLAELVPKYLPEVPVSALNGKPLGYSADPNAWRVYSVGTDLADHGGKRAADRTGDLVFYLEDVPERHLPKGDNRRAPPAPPPNAAEQF